MLAGADGAGERTVVLPLLHGPMGEDGTVQGMLELADVAYVGAGVLGSALAMDKAMAKQVLAANGIPQARYRAFARARAHARPARRAGRRPRPAVLRQAGQHGLVGRRHQGPHGRGAARRHRRTPSTYDEWVVVEEAVVGREIEVAVLGNLDPEASGPARSSPAPSSTTTRTSTSPTAPSCSIPAPLTPRADRRGAGAGRAGVPRCCAATGWPASTSSSRRAAAASCCNEVNTMPGFTPISMYPKLWQAAGMSYPELIDRLVELALDRHARRRRNTKH